MTQSDTINLTSLGLVRNELVATIEQAANKLEQFAADRENGELLQNCIETIQQISGTLSLIQLQGADLLAQELLELASDITLGDDIENQLSVLTNSFFILPRYLEYAQQTRRSLPVLLIPYINEIRAARKQPLITDSHFFKVNVNVKRQGQGRGSAVFSEDLKALTRRLRHMYQVGLLGVLQDRQIKPSYAMMKRTVERLDTITGDRPLGKLWWLASIALEQLAEESMELSKSRKLLLGILDRQIKQLQTKGHSVFDNEPNPALIKELVYLIALSENHSKNTQLVQKVFKYEPLSYTDRELLHEKEALKGPSASTVSSVAAVLKDELRSTKEILELASQGGVISAEDYASLIDTMGKVADILSVVGLVSASQTLKSEIQKVEKWRDSGDSVDAKDLLEVADTLLYVESTISGLEKLNLSDEKLTKANSIARNEVIASNQLAEAELVVLKEVEAGFALIKRALSSFVESNYDRGHIKNVASTLNTIRGGMVVLSLSRAAAVVHNCADFVEETLMVNDHPAALRQLLETFADAIIGLEYYLDAIKTDKQADDSVLQVAEESLQALGHPVEE